MDDDVTHTEGPDTSGPMQSLVDLQGVEAVVLVDGAGRVLEQVGLTEREVLAQVATLAAATHASGTRLNEVTGGRGLTRMVLSSEGWSASIVPVGSETGGPILLVFGRVDALPQESVDEALAQLQRVVTEMGLGSGTIGDRDAFEASLLESLDRVLMGQQGHESGPEKGH